MKKIILLTAAVALSLTMLSCGSSKQTYNDAKVLMQEQIVNLSSAGTLDELMEMQMQNGDTIVELMTILEPELTPEQKVDLQMLNQAYNQRLKTVADSLVQLTIVDSMVVMQ